MSYVIRNYGAAKDVPFKGCHISIQRDGCIVTDDMELVNAAIGQPQMYVGRQPGTVDVPPEQEPVDYTKMPKRELLELAEERGLEVPDKATKADIIELLIADDEG